MGAGSSPGPGTKIPHATQAKKLNVKIFQKHVIEFMPFHPTYVSMQIGKNPVYSGEKPRKAIVNSNNKRDNKSSAAPAS